MNLLLYTPKHRWVAALVTGFWYAVQPAREFLYHTINQNRGVYATNADSIGIPIYQFLWVWERFAPIFVLLVVLCLWRYPGKVPLWTWNTGRPWRSAIASLATVAVIALALDGVPFAVSTNHPEEIISIVWFLLAAAWLRSSFVGPHPSQGR